MAARRLVGPLATFHPRSAVADNRGRVGSRPMSSPLQDRVVVMSGGSRGIGLAIAVALARAGARIALLAKTDQPHPRLPGTIHTAAGEIEAAGGQALPVVGDVRDEEQVDAFVAAAAKRWGRVDAVVNNASAINLAPIADLPPKRYDLMLGINTRGTFVLTRAALPHLRESDHAHVLTLSPPLSADPRWLRGHAVYTVSKMGMTMLTLGVAEDERERGIGANCLWPRTLIATAAVQNLLGGEKAMAMSRTPEIVADAARVILERDPREATGNAYIDDEVLAAAGVTDLERYRAAAGELALDLFVEGWPAPA
jgi:citronellol/citronellal dehydrogenase